MANRLKFSKQSLDKLARSKHQKQITVGDSGQPGLCVLVSQATVTFRVAFYLPSIPGKPQYVKIGRYPDGQYTYPYKDSNGRDIVIDCNNIDAVRRAASDIRNRAQRGID